MNNKPLNLLRIIVLIDFDDLSYDKGWDYSNADERKINGERVEEDKSDKSEGGDWKYEERKMQK